MVLYQLATINLGSLIQITREQTSPLFTHDEAIGNSRKTIGCLHFVHVCTFLTMPDSSFEFFESAAAIN